MLFLLPYTILNNNFCTANTREEKKTQEKIETRLEHVVGNLGTFFLLFQKSTTILKNMNKKFAALIAYSLNQSHYYYQYS